MKLIHFNKDITPPVDHWLPILHLRVNEFNAVVYETSEYLKASDVQRVLDLLLNFSQVF